VLFVLDSKRKRPIDVQVGPQSVMLSGGF
jgi:hypothetical protein